MDLDSRQQSFFRYLDNRNAYNERQGADLVMPLLAAVDFDLLGRIDPGTGRIKGPSVYAEMVWSCRQRRAVARKPPIDWVVMRNRLSTLESRNKRRVGTAMQTLSRRIGFRTIPGFSERVIFRELFLNGLTLLDLKEGGQIALTLSHVAARQEVREMVRALGLPEMQ
jgi:chromosome partitioning protein